MPSTVVAYVEDCDEVYQRALDAGATSFREPDNMFYGDRSAGVVDPLGYHWWIHTHIEDVSEEEMMRRAAAAAPLGVRATGQPLPAAPQPSSGHEASSSVRIASRL
jgi:hypothetical protein